jgi:hypothetical protein
MTCRSDSVRSELRCSCLTLTGFVAIRVGDRRLVNSFETLVLLDCGVVEVLSPSVLLERGLQVRDFDVAATKPFASLDFGDREVADKGDLISRFRKDFRLGLLVAPGLSVFGLNSIIVNPLGLAFLTFRLIWPG